jgi:hypothetical protein
VGVSLGGNALMRWAGEDGSVRGRASWYPGRGSVCSPIDLAAGGWAIGRGFNRLVYTRMFLNTMKPKACANWPSTPGLFDREALLAAQDLYEPSTTSSPRRCTASRAPKTIGRVASAKPRLHRHPCSRAGGQCPQRPLRAGLEPAQASRARWGRG